MSGSARAFRPINLIFFCGQRRCTCFNTRERLRLVTLNWHTCFIFLIFISVNSHATTYIKEIVYTVPKTESRMQATERALAILRTEALQESGVVLEHALNIGNMSGQFTLPSSTSSDLNKDAQPITHQSNWHSETTRQFTSALSNIKILSEQYDGEDLFLKVQINVDEDTLLKGYVDAHKMQLMESQFSDLQNKIQALHEEKLAQEKRLRMQNIQTQEDRIKIKHLKERIKLFERLNHEDIHNQERLSRAVKTAKTLKKSVQHRNSKRNDRFKRDIEFVKNAWAPGMTIKDIRQYHRFVNKPFYSEDEKRVINLSTRTDLSVSKNPKQNMLAERDIYIMSQGILKTRKHFLVVTTFPNDDAVQDIFIARTVRHRSASHIIVDTHSVIDSKAEDIVSSFQLED